MLELFGMVRILRRVLFTGELMRHLEPLLGP